MTFRNTGLCLGFLAVLIALTMLTARDVTAADDFPPTYVQVFLGAAQFNEDSLTFLKTSTENPAEGTTNDLSTMPYLGVGGQYAFSEANSHVGLDATIFIGWRSRNSSVTAGNGQAVISLDTELWLLDLAMGFYAQTIFADNWRIYGAAGPLMLFGQYSEDTKEDEPEDSATDATEESTSDSEFGVGGYARFGLEYRLANNAFMGVCVRGGSTNLEFDSAVADGSLDGIQGFITYSQPF